MRNLSVNVSLSSTVENISICSLSACSLTVPNFYHFLSYIDFKLKVLAKRWSKNKASFFRIYILIEIELAKKENMTKKTKTVTEETILKLSVSMSVFQNGDLLAKFPLMQCCGFA